MKNVAQVAVFTGLVREKLPEGLQSSIVDNIANKRSFSLQMLGSPKFVGETNEHVRVKRALHPKNGTVFDFMIRPPSDESPVIESPLLNAPETNFANINSETTQVKFKMIERLLKEHNIEGFNLSCSSDDQILLLIFFRYHTSLQIKNLIVIVAIAQIINQEREIPHENSPLVKPP